MNERFALIEFCDFRDAPVGGQLSFARNLLSEYGQSFAYVGLGKPGEQIGKWHVNDTICERARFLFVGNVRSKSGRPLVPRRLAALWMCLRHRDELSKLKDSTLLVQSPEALLVARLIGAQRIIYRFAGTANPVRHSRYRVLRLGARFADLVFDVLLRSVKYVFVTADRNALKAVVAKMKRIADVPVVWLPTTYDERIFFPPKVHAEAPRTRLLYVGRLNSEKSCDLLIRAFEQFLRRHPEATMDLVGEGEEKAALTELAKRLGVSDAVRFLGARTPDEIGRMMRESAAFVFASRREGWPTVLVEAAASGLFIVSSRVSGAEDIIVDESIGVVVERWDVDDFAAAFEIAWRQRARERAASPHNRVFARSEIRKAVDAALCHVSGFVASPK